MHVRAHLVTQFLSQSAVFALVAAAALGSARAGTFTVFGPESFVRETRGPKIELRTFSVPNPDTDYFIRASTGLSGHDLPAMVSSANVSINGVLVLRPKDFGKKLTDTAVALSESNEIAVELRGKPGGAAVFEVYGIDEEPPTITTSMNPLPNAHGWNNSEVTVSFSCDDAISGVESCTEPITISTEGGNQVVTGKAVDRAGNTASASVTVRLDTTPPEIRISWPLMDGFGTDRGSVEIEGEATDNLSGILSALVRDHAGEGGLSVPLFATVRALQTDIPVGELSRGNPFELEATDLAGNLASQTFLVRHILSTTVVPTDRERTELSTDGVMTSVDRILIRFNSSVSRDAIHQIAAEEGGRVAGFLPATNTALVAFETDNLVALESVFQSLGARSEVEEALSVVFVTPTATFDNDLLGSPDNAAYESINSSAAANFILDNGLAFSPATVAVIDSGLSDDHGLSGEFANVSFFDLCIPEGQEGRTGIPVDTLGAHGTKVTGIVGGANNGHGNNGLVSGFSGSQYGVKVFRTDCSTLGGYLDGVLIEAAMDLIVNGTAGAVDVVNMSFAGGSSGYYLPYFDSASGQGILWVASAGNVGVEHTCGVLVGYPAGLACNLGNVLSVGGYDPANLTRSDSVYGDAVTLFAPGSNVHTATGSSSYGPVGGTSAASALVAGAATLVLGTNLQDAFELKQLLKDTTQPLSDPDLPQGGLHMLYLIETAGLSPVDQYARHVQSYRQQYGKSAEWKQWMLDNRGRYESAFDAARARPATLDIAFRYDTVPIAYDPPWIDEAEHMSALEAFIEPAYPGYDFHFIYNGDTDASYANVIGGIPTNLSHASGKNMYLYFETILNHEFAHVMDVWHHYDTVDEIGDGNHMPPGETKCNMDRNSYQLCSACRTALHIPLDIDNHAAIDAAFWEIWNRIPY